MQVGRACAHRATVSGVAAAIVDPRPTASPQPPRLQQPRVAFVHPSVFLAVRLAVCRSLCLSSGLPSGGKQIVDAMYDAHGCVVSKHNQLLGQRVVCSHCPQLTLIASDHMVRPSDGRVRDRIEHRRAYRTLQEAAGVFAARVHNGNEVWVG